MMKATNLFLIFLSFFSISTSAQYVKFESVNLVCDAVVNGQVGLKIVATYTVTAQPGHTLYVDMGVMDTYGNPIYRPDGYAVFDRIVKKQTRKTQRYVNDAVFLPAWAFSNLTGGSYQLNAVVQVMDADSNMSLGVSNYVQFAYNGVQQQNPNNGGYNNGGYNNGGNVPRQPVKCGMCHGSGKCWMCAGRGEKRYPGNYGVSGGVMECQQCSGTGQCKYCYGRGTR